MTAVDVLMGASLRMRKKPRPDYPVADELEKLGFPQPGGKGPSWWDYLNAADGNVNVALSMAMSDEAGR